MTINVLRGRRAVEAARPEAPSEPLPIGDEGTEIFSCPACTRPLAVGSRRCPRCRTRLVRGVRATTAAAFVASGLIVGLCLGVAVVALPLAVGTPATAAADPTAVPAATAGTPVASAAPIATVAPPPLPAIPAAAVSALERTAEMNARLAAQAPILQAALVEPSLDTFVVAGVLRAMTADAAYATGAADRLGAWDDAAALSAGLAAVYADVRAIALEGLASSLASEPAYRTAATRMLAVLAGLAPLDAASRDLAVEAGVELPVVALPDGIPDPAATDAAVP